MLVELGNVAPVDPNAVAPTVTYINVPDSYTYVPATSAAALAVEVMREVVNGQPNVTHLPDQEAVVGVVSTWPSHSNASPTWVWSDNEDFAVLLGHYFDCPVGRPDDVEATHHTNAGPAGVAPVEALEVTE